MDEQDHQRDYWDSQAASFDSEPDHGLHDPAILKAWESLLVDHFPTRRETGLDLGCGTGSITQILARHFHEVEGWDFSSKMVEWAARKNRDHPLARFFQNDAFAANLVGSYDLVFSRHLLWMSKDRVTTLKRWKGLLAEGGRLLLVEGFWTTGVGIAPRDLLTDLGDLGWNFAYRELSTEESLWGKPVQDRRYLVAIEAVKKNRLPGEKKLT